MMFSDFGRIYERLDVTLQERGESFYQKRMGIIVDDVRKAG